MESGGSSEDASSESEQDQPSRGNAARAARRSRNLRQDGRERSDDEGVSEEITYVTHDVVAVFGEADGGKPEVWLGVKCAMRQNRSNAKRVKMQFLEKNPDRDTYVLLDCHNTYHETQVEHTFERVRFQITVTKEYARQRKRATGKKRTKTKTVTETVDPIDAAILERLLAQAVKEHNRQ